MFSVDAFVAQFSSDGTTLLNEMILEGSGIQGAFGVSVDAAGIITVAGQTESTDFPVTADTLQGTYDIFLTRLDSSKKPEKQLVSSILFGGSGSETLSVEPVNDGFTTVCIAGATRSVDLPGVEGSYDDTFSGTNLDAFVAKYNLDSMGYSGKSD